ncbi:MAG: fibronectin type III domain-containing protein [Chitinispirillaceae bacterium]|nr:fibronectin type III domain-containing protein [Chitinispirillaceae bacterium]
MPDSIELRFKGVPAPGGLTIGYDTLNEAVLLTWNPLDTSLIDGFNVYRALKGENFSLITTTPLPETAKGFINHSVKIDTTYEYRVVARNKAGEESRLVDIEADTVVTVSRSEVITTIEWGTTGTINDTASVGDTVGIVVGYSNPTRVIRKVLWYIGEYTGELAIPVKEKTDSSLSGNDTLNYRWDTHGSKLVTVRIFDDGGVEWMQRFLIKVLDYVQPVKAGSE